MGNRAQALLTEVCAEMDRQERITALLHKIAALSPATKDYEPGIGAGMLNQLIDEAKALLTQ